MDTRFFHQDFWRSIAYTWYHGHVVNDTQLETDAEVKLRAKKSDTPNVLPEAEYVGKINWEGKCVWFRSRSFFKRNTAITFLIRNYAVTGGEMFWPQGKVWALDVAPLD